MLLNFPTHGFIIDRDNDLTPPGGFINLMNNRPEVYHNHHLVGEPSHFVPFKPPGHFGTSPSQEETTPHSSPVNVDSEDEVVRTEKRILWTEEEDVRLVSCLIQFGFSVIVVI
jgi:hypothetical protein